MHPLLRFPLVLVALTTACQNATPESFSPEAPSTATEPAKEPAPGPTHPEQAPLPAGASTPASTSPPAEAATTASFVDGSNALGTALFAETRKTKSGNFSLSPLSISLALTMGAAGARGETEKEMGHVLGWSGERDQALASAGEILKSWGAAKEGPRLDLTQRMFGQENAAFLPEYLSLLDTVFHAPLERVNFLRSPEISRKHINTWVASKTNERIKELIPRGSIDASTRLVLVNALFFLADWQQAFDKQKTAEAKFHLSAKDSVTAPMMNGRSKYGYAYVGDAHLLDIPYEGGELSMTFILPWKKHQLSLVEKQLNANTLKDWIRKLEEKTVLVSLPRFEMKGQTISLKPSLIALGMKSAFTGSANFQGIAPPDGAPLILSDVVHQTYVKVDEAGTEAAAATALIMSKSVSVGGGGGYSFIADEPFLFFIRDRTSGAILFVGRVTDPTTN